MKKSILLFMSFAMLAFTACNNDDDNATASGGVAFAIPSVNLTGDVTPLNIVFSEPTKQSGTLTLNLVSTGVVYGTDFTTVPAAAQNAITVPFQSGVSTVAVSFTKLKNAVEGEVKNVKFTITATSLNGLAITGNTSMQANFNETASAGSSLAPAVGGGTQPNQVYLDLSSGAMTVVERVSWDLGFYSGTDFRIVLNSSLKMSAKQLNSTNIDQVVAEDPSMIIGQGAGSLSQIDNPNGLIGGTTIAAVSSNDADNKVYLVYLGNGPGSNPAAGSVNADGGPARGWKKVRILKSGNDYKVQYANIGETTHQEKVITKNAAYNFTFFSFTANNTVQVEPKKDKWDLNFTTFTNSAGPTTPYFFPDFIINNLKGGARAYKVMTSAVTFENFKRSDVVDANFTEDQRGIGSDWRGTSVTGPDGNPVSQFVLRTDRFYVVKDPAGNLYKLKMTGGIKLATGERGNPTFQYSLL